MVLAVSATPRSGCGELSRAWPDGSGVGRCEILVDPAEVSIFIVLPLLRSAPRHLYASKQYAFCCWPGRPIALANRASMVV